MEDPIPDTSPPPRESSAFSEYVATGAREALDRLVRQHLDFVYATARRQVRDPHLAEDVTQAVFLVLAKRAKTIRQESSLSSWLFKAVRYAAANAIKMEQRRRRHEQAAASERREPVMSQSALESESMLPLLNDAIAALSESDRQAVLLRYLQGQTMIEVGATLGVNEMAARKRVGRAVERLRELFLRRGVKAGSESVGAMLILAAKETAPAHLSGAISAAFGGASAPTAVTIAHGMHWMFALAKAKAAAAIAVAIIVVAATGAAVLKSRPPHVETPIAQQPKPAAAPAAVSTDSQTELAVLCRDAGKPVGGAEVYIAESIYRRDHSIVSNWMNTPVLSDSSGLVRFGAFVPRKPDDISSTRQVYARVPGRSVAFKRQMWSRGANDADFASVTLALEPSILLHGVITVPAGFKPESAKITTAILSLPGNGSAFGEMLWREDAPTDGFLPQIYDTDVKADGSFSIGDVPAAGAIHLIANAAGLGEAMQMIPAPAIHPAVSIVMRPEATVGGGVFDPDGKPIPNVTVVAEQLGAEMPVSHRYSGTTDAKGIYVIHRLPGIYVGLLASTNDYVMPVQPIRLTSGNAIVQDLHLQRGALVSGSASDPEGKPLANVSLAAGSPGIDLVIGRSETNERGRYSIRLPAGKMTISISGPPDGFDYPKQKDASRTIDIAPDAVSVAGPTWRLPRAKPQLPYATATLQGRIVDEHGKGIPNLPICDSRIEDWGIQMMPVSDSHAAKTDADGHYAFKIQARIEHQLSPSSPDYDRPQTREVTPQPDETLTIADLVVHPRPIIGTASGIVVDPHGHPLEKARVESGLDTTESDDQGRFTVPIRANDRKLLTVLKSGYKYRNWNDVPPGAKDLRLTLYPSPDTGPDYNARTKAPSIASLLNMRAPAFHADWVFADGDAPTVGRADGKMTVLAFDWDSDVHSDAGSARKFATDLAKICATADAAGVVIYTPQSTDPGVRAIFGGKAPGVSIGIDEYWGEANPNDVNAVTRMAYGAAEMRTVFVISADGTLVYSQKGLKGLDGHLVN